MTTRGNTCRLYLGVLLGALLIISACSGSGGGAPSASVTVTISGQVQYEDKLYTSAGFTTATTYRPVRFADIDIIEADNSRVLASGMTDSIGSYSMICTLPVATVYVRVMSAAVPLAALASSTVQVKSLSNSLFGVPGSSFVASDNPAANISIPATNSAAGAFNILDVYTSAYQFINSLGKNPPSLNVFWQMGGQDGTYYCSSGCWPGNGIYVLGGDDIYGNGDTDHYDDDVLWHEFGHFITDKFSRDESPGGSHNFGANDQDMRLSWSEGWGDFFPGAIKSWMSLIDVNSLSATGIPAAWYVDTENNTTLISWDFGAPIGPNYSSSETAVANVLLQLRNAFGMQSIWDVVTSAVFTAMSPVNLEAFWDTWVSSGKTIADPVPTIYGSRSIYYSLDSFETDSPFVSALTYTNTPQNHTLYNAGDMDMDYVLFSASAGSLYTITTSSLRNGADTYLTLYDSSFIKLLENDNASGITYVSGGNYDYYDVSGDYVYPHNNATTLSSLLRLTSIATGTLYVEIKSSPNRPKSAGKYGSYTLTITSP